MEWGGSRWGGRGGGNKGHTPSTWSTAASWIISYCREPAIAFFITACTPHSAFRNDITTARRGGSGFAVTNVVANSTRCDLLAGFGADHDDGAKFSLPKGLCDGHSLLNGQFLRRMRSELMQLLTNAVCETVVCTSRAWPHLSPSGVSDIAFVRDRLPASLIEPGHKRHSCHCSSDCLLSEKRATSASTQLH